MRKFLAILCASMLCVCCLALAACGGSSSGSAAASGSASASASSASASSAADPTEQFVGTWKLAGAETQGITIAGDFGAIVGQELDMTFTIEKGGTATASLNGEAISATWESTGDDITITTKPETDSSDSSASASDSESAATPTTLTGTLEDGVLKLNSPSDDSYTMLLTKDGKLPNAPEIDADKATAITSEDALIGSWNLSGLNMMGITMYGDADDLAAMSGGVDMSLAFEKGGKCTISGEEATYTVSADGAALEQAGQSVPIKALGDSIALDMSDMLGMPMIIVYSK